MKILECKDSISRFRFAQSCVGLTGCLCVTYAVWTPFWLKERGIWTEWNITKTDHDHYSDGMVINALQAQRVFGVISFLTAVSTAALCLVFALCWTSETVRSYSNTRALLMAGQALYPTTLLLLTMLTTGFFFLLCWSLFTYQHREEIHEDFSSLGSSYWLGALGWILLLLLELVVFAAEQVVVPDILPDLERSVEKWRAACQFKYTHLSLSDAHHPAQGCTAPNRSASDP
ncbi:uncharacterized protein si:ch211-256a21.4 [Synchiropus splendidus]|uniref:uncharacterized protein si:ch211-256a21.4 n=1 Tax=Synchiropus splendidus TaxID=270530 RepID=UPI00237DD8C5|nr:uncharacterized protein si:ch211-256a21.4 [Synchiropus splendidus]